VSAKYLRSALSHLNFVLEKMSGNDVIHLGKMSWCLKGGNDGREAIALSSGNGGRNVYVYCVCKARHWTVSTYTKCAIVNDGGSVVVNSSCGPQVT
jgi:hypothetical protein